MQLLKNIGKNNLKEADIGTLYIFSGLPGSGKSTLASKLAKRLSAAYLRIDILEQGLKDILQISDVGGAGYQLNYLIAKENLKNGIDVIADSVNPIKLTRDEWNDVAKSVGAKYINIEILCSDKIEHRKRVESRDVGIKNLKMPTWEQVKNREYHRWIENRIQIDTAGKKIEDCIKELERKIKGFS